MYHTYTPLPTHVFTHSHIHTHTLTYSTHTPPPPPESHTHIPWPDFLVSLLASSGNSGLLLTRREGKESEGKVKLAPPPTNFHPRPRGSWWTLSPLRWDPVYQNLSQRSELWGQGIRWVAPFGVNNWSTSKDCQLLESQRCAAGWGKDPVSESFPVTGAWLPPAGREAQAFRLTPLCSGSSLHPGLGQEPLLSCQIVITWSCHEAGVWSSLPIPRRC